jgi:hypothetical protein
VRARSPEGTEAFVRRVEFAESFASIRERAAGVALR